MHLSVFQLQVCFLHEDGCNMSDSPVLMMMKCFETCFFFHAQYKKDLFEAEWLISFSPQIPDICITYIILPWVMEEEFKLSESGTCECDINIWWVWSARSSLATFFSIFNASSLLPSPVGSQDSLLEITFRSTIPPVMCDPTTPKPELSAVNLPALSAADGTINAFSSSNGTLGSPLGRDQCLLKLECFRFLPGPPGPPPPRLPSPPPPLKPNRLELKSPAGSEGRAELLSADVKSLGSLDFARFRESGIASEYESNTDDSDDSEDGGEDGEEGMEIFGWGTDEETLRLLNVLNRQATPDCLGDEIAV